MNMQLSFTVDEALQAILDAKGMASAGKWPGKSMTMIESTLGDNDDLNGEDLIIVQWEPNPAPPGD